MISRSRHVSLAPLALGMALLVSAAGCEAPPDDLADTGEAAEAAAADAAPGIADPGARPVASAGAISVAAPWVRPAAPLPGDTVPVNSAGYLVVRNAGAAPDRLEAVEVAGVGRVEVHRSAVVDGGMRMTPVDSLVVPAEGAVELRPGEIHLMLMDVREPLVAGDTALLRLRFREAGTLEVRAPITHLPPGG